MKKGEEWKDQGFGWDDMQPGIYKKIEKAQPNFFQKRKRRYLVFWLFGFIVIGGLTFLLFNQYPQNEDELSKEELSSTNIAQQSTKAASLSVPNNNDPITDLQNTKTPTLANTESVISPSTKKTNNAEQFSEQVLPIEADFSNQRTTNQESATTPKRPIQNDLKVFITDQSPINKTKLKNTSNELKAANNPTEKLNAIHLWEQINTIPLVDQKAVADIDFPLPYLNQPSKTDLPENEAEKNWQLMAIGGATFSANSFRGSSPAVALRDESLDPAFGFQYGVEAWRSLGEKSQLLLGLGRQQTYQYIDSYTERPVPVEKFGEVVAVTRYVVGNREVRTHADTTIIATEKNTIKYYNQTRSWYAQLGIARSFELSRFTISPMAGMTYRLTDWQEGYTLNSDGSILSYNNDSPIFRKHQYGAFVGLQTAFDLTPIYALNLRYQINQQLNNSSLEANTTWRPSSHFLGLGISMRLK